MTQIQVSHKTAGSGPARLGRRLLTLFPVLCALAGMLVLAYPVAVSHWNNNQQLIVSRQFEAENQNSSPAELQGFLNSARHYNSAQAGGPILDPWLNRVSEDNVDYQGYLDELSSQTAMARLVVPAIDVDLPVFHGTSERVLRSGVGHLYGSHLPVGGEGTHALLTGHTGIPEATLFDNLDRLDHGDALYVSVAGEHLKYEVSDINVVLPHETDSLRPVAGQDLVTLITCTPYGINTHRLLVTAHRVPMDEADAAQITRDRAIWEWWMYVLVGVIALVLIALLVSGARSLRQRRAAAKQDSQEESL
ncbi:class C sortase [Corynebacterium sp.]|uniref:class C sortase n=1 Tax=Corynebacterium sp. TaxID=1720 RepID=UPI00199EE149|nr:class C sortase [Corynebacterium sp.]HHU68578.1 class C sortase [Corynebacterium sp.]